jgi:hypothetical protein
MQYFELTAFDFTVLYCAEMHTDDKVPERVQHGHTKLEEPPQRNII